MIAVEKINLKYLGSLDHPLAKVLRENAKMVLRLWLR
jgi:hypothetical protein